MRQFNNPFGCIFQVETKIRKLPKLPLSLEAASNHILYGHSSISEKYKEDLLGKTVPRECEDMQSPSCPSHMSSQGTDNGEGTDYHVLNDSEEKANDSPGAKNLEKDAFFLTQVIFMSKSVVLTKIHALDYNKSTTRCGNGCWCLCQFWVNVVSSGNEWKFCLLIDIKLK